LSRDTLDVSHAIGFDRDQMPRRAGPAPDSPSRRRFLVTAAAVPAALACSGAPQNVPPPRAAAGAAALPRSVAEAAERAPAARDEPRDPGLAGLRSYRLADGIEPAFVFQARPRR
jgi:hypothetical protein